MSRPSNERTASAETSVTPRAPLGLSVVALALTLFAPIPAYLHHLHWTALSFEGLVLLAGCLLISLAALVLPWARYRLPLALIFSLAILFFVDFQYSQSWSLLKLLLVVVPTLAVCWLTFLNLPRLAAVGFGIFALLSLPPFAQQTKLMPKAGEPNLPPIIHIVLDEHTGLSSLGDVGQEAEIKEFVRQTWLSRGFRLFENAHSLYNYTKGSLASAFNGNLQTDALSKASGLVATHTNVLHRAEIFKMQKDRGYQLAFFDSDWINMCEIEGAPADVCSRTSPWTLGPLLESLPRFAPERVARVLFAMTPRSNFIRHLGATPSMKWLLESLGLPAWPDTQLTGPLGSQGTLENLQVVLKEPRGWVFFAHLLAPHSPYQLGSECRIKRSDEWRTRFFVGPRELVRSSYLEQIECVSYMMGDFLDRVLQMPGFEDATIVVHGDHGARILSDVEAILDDPVAQQERMALDGFSTLLAIRSPQIEPGLESAPVSLNDFFSRAWLGRTFRAPHRLSALDSPDDATGGLKTLPLPKQWALEPPSLPYLWGHSSEDSF